MLFSLDAFLTSMIRLVVHISRLDSHAHLFDFLTGFRIVSEIILGRSQVMILGRFRRPMIRFGHDVKQLSGFG
jgi:hypothetical protein